MHLPWPRFRQGFPRWLADYRRLNFVLLCLLTLVMGGLGLRVELDPRGVSFSPTDSGTPEMRQIFNDGDDYVLLAVAHDRPLNDPGLREGLRQIRTLLSAAKGVKGVMDLDRMARIPLPEMAEINRKWSRQLIAPLYQTIPGLGQLVSRDGRVLGILIRVDNETLNGPALEEFINRAKLQIHQHLPGVISVHSAGIPVLRAAFERYNLTSAAIFGALGMVLGMALAFLLFRTLWAALLVLVSSLVSLIFLTGMMGLLGIGLNMASGLGFGFVLIVSCTTVFHMLSRFTEALPPAGTTVQGPAPESAPESALETTYARVIRPCFMCALTTAAGFFSLTFSPVPMVAQAGWVIALGVVFAFFVALPVTAFIMPLAFTGRPPGHRDLLHHAGRLLRIPGSRFPRATLVLAMIFCLLMAAGIPRISMVRHLSQPMVGRTQTAKDMAFVRHHLSSGISFSLILTPAGNPPPSRRFWYDLLRLEKAVTDLDGVVGLDSMTPYIFRTALKASPAGIRPEQVYQNLGDLPGAQELVSTFLDTRNHAVRLVVHIHDRSSDQIEALLSGVTTLAREIMGNQVRTKLAGQLIFLRGETTALVRAQTRALLVTLTLITLLMIIQLRSVFLGMLSLVPNVLPLLTIFGIMGWAGIPLDPLTIFAAVISFGLSVDDSIHFLTAYRRIGVTTDPKKGHATDQAYTETARALIATTAVLFFAALGLGCSPFAHVASLGLLIASASLTALAGDIMVLPALLRITATPSVPSQTGPAHF